MLTGAALAAAWRLVAGQRDPRCCAPAAWERRRPARRARRRRRAGRDGAQSDRDDPVALQGWIPPRGAFATAGIILSVVAATARGARRGCSASRRSATSGVSPTACTCGTTPLFLWLDQRAHRALRRPAARPARRGDARGRGPRPSTSSSARSDTGSSCVARRPSPSRRGRSWRPCRSSPRPRSAAAAPPAGALPPQPPFPRSGPCPHHRRTRRRSPWGSRIAPWTHLYDVNEDDAANPRVRRHVLERPDRVRSPAPDERPLQLNPGPHVTIYQRWRHEGGDVPPRRRRDPGGPLGGPHPADREPDRRHHPAGFPGAGRRGPHDGRAPSPRPAARASCSSPRRAPTAGSDRTVSRGPRTRRDASRSTTGSSDRSPGAPVRRSLT